MTKRLLKKITVKDNLLVAKDKDLINEDNVRRIIIKNKDNKQLVELPLTVGVVGAILTPVLAE